MLSVLVILSGEVISEEYSLEYGTDIMEMHVGAVQAGERALIIDDLIATGGTLCAAMRLLGSVFICDYTGICILMLITELIHYFVFFLLTSSPLLKGIL